MARKDQAWNPDEYGYGKHDYRHVDPNTINVEDFAVNLRGEQKHRGDVREENTAGNEMHPENGLDLDALSKVGTIFTTEAEQWPGVWKVVRMPAVRSPNVFTRVKQVSGGVGGFEGSYKEEGEEIEINCTDLGVAVGPDNLFVQVKGKLIEKGKHQGL